ncbi:hypothetical protein I7I50_06257 [Histoplasma capsulatum G186AR]|uniref:Uncharacterized protein n=1 Tax=Ajellomyces capsulatus TaxID=5037 RepID=A0A8H7YX70_AJECA|nr:hypothetical protein I7I52_10670 [Histoplasma capsulatum]QSS67242.1 hypothetical protein I7I50_06257 [Histoplasma capsulatum G186AR]
MPCKFAAGLIGSGRFRFWQPRCVKVCPRCIFTRGRDIVRRRDGGAMVVVVVMMTMVTMMTDNGSDKAAAGAADTAGNRKQSGMGAENARIRFRTSRYDRYHRYIQPPQACKFLGLGSPPKIK